MFKFERIDSGGFAIFKTGSDLEYYSAQMVDTALKARAQVLEVFLGRSQEQAIRAMLSELRKARDAFAAREGELNQQGKHRPDAAPARAEKMPAEPAGPARPAKASVIFLRAVTGFKGGSHAEGCFCPVQQGSIYQRLANKFYLTAQGIEDRMAPLAADHPDRAVYAQALAAVQDHAAGLKTALEAFDHRSSPPPSPRRL